MVHQGVKVLDERIADIRSQYDPRSIHFEPLDPAADISTLRFLPEVERVDRSDKSYEIRLAEGISPSDAMRRIIQAVVPARIELARPRLEDIFINLVSGGTATAEAEEKLRAGLGNGEAKAAAI
jgi:ABC-type uncharacterized transport system ATPase subunit